MVPDRNFLSWAVLLWLPAQVLVAAEVDYVRDIKPVLSRRCFSCHGGLKQEQDLRLDTAELMKKGGASGPAVIAGQSGTSLILSAIQGTNGASRMPPEGEPLTPEQIELIRQWIDEGANAPHEEPLKDPAQHWAYLNPVRAPLPTGIDPAWTQNPVDAFVAAGHLREQLTASPMAPDRVLLRRVYIDLTGLPPTRDQMRAFLADTRPAAFERVVDQLLASPQYGERWGRHWMDVWRYSDWDGYGQEVRESKPHIWRWRDWIIESLNADKGYDQMLQEMLAGDELAPDDPQVRRATGYLVRNWYSFNRNVWLDATIEHTAKAFLGTTLNCARCHDHMYDPLAQTEYYQFRAFFEAHDVRTDRMPSQSDLAKDGLVHVYDARAETPTYLFQRGNEKQFDKDQPLPALLPAIFRKTELKIEPVPIPATAYYPGLRPFQQTESTQQAQAGFDAAQVSLTAAREKLASAKQELSQNATDPKLAQGVAISELQTLLAERTVSTALANLLWVQSRIQADRATYATPPAENGAALTQIAALAEREYNMRLAEQTLTEAELKLAEAKRDPGNAQPIATAETALAAALKGRDTAIEALKQPATAYTRFGPVYPSTSTGRRLALARWIASQNNPLTARVAVNHIWLRHFGQPLVPTVFDFGLNGKAPTHPELLDWLAVELMENGWKMKPIHKLIVMSRTYRQQSLPPSSHDLNRMRDPDNLYLWRNNARRMEAEAVRDATLLVSGNLDLTSGGPELDEASGMNVPRRSLYFRNSKEKKMTFLDTFDRPNVVDCYRRSESIVPQQALALANSPLSLMESRRLAGKLTEEVAGLSEEVRTPAFISAAFDCVLNRAPSPVEMDECVTFLTLQATKLREQTTLSKFTGGAASAVPPSDSPEQRVRENLVHVLLNHNDFITVR